MPLKVDENLSKLLFTPRKPKSVWSKLNKTHTEKLIENELMTKIGLAKIEAAKRDYSWNALDASDNLEIPNNLAKAFERNAVAKKNFESFTDSAKRAVLSWVFSAKRDETRAARIEKTIAMAAKNKRANFDKE